MDTFNENYGKLVLSNGKIFPVDENLVDLFTSCNWSFKEGKAILNYLDSTIGDVVLIYCSLSKSFTLEEEAREIIGVDGLDGLRDAADDYWYANLKKLQDAGL